MSERLVIRADATPNMGSGHVMRMIALAQEWKRKGGEVLFVSNISTPWLKDRIQVEGFSLKKPGGVFPDPEDIQSLLALTNADDPIVIDGYHFDSTFMNAIRSEGRNTVVMDDVNDRGNYTASLLVNQNVDADRYDYTVNPEARILGGTQYALLRREFIEYPQSPKSTPTEATNILLTFGGADTDNRTGLMLKTLEKTGIKTLNVKVVAGPFNPHWDTLYELARSLPFHCELLESVDDMAALMDWADMAVCAAGSTCWELCFFGVPMILSVIAENQRGIAEGLSAKGAAILTRETPSPSEIANVIRDHDLRKAMRKAARTLVDGKGSKRIVDMLSEHRFSDMTLRPAVLEDWEVLLEWRNNANIRKQSFNSDPIEEDTHIAWLKGQLADDRTLLLIGEMHGKPVGQIRFNNTNGESVVSISVAPDSMGKGLGTRLLRQGCSNALQHFPDTTVVAMVKESNPASMHLFEKVGFESVEHFTDNNGAYVRFELRADHEHK